MIEPISNKPGYYLVSSERNPDRRYMVHARGKQCDCADWTYRQAERGGLCKHVLQVLGHLDQLAACPNCGGRGQHVARFQGYASGSDPIPCSCCNGTGRRDGADPYLLAAADQYRAALEEAALRDLFR